MSFVNCVDFEILKGKKITSIRQIKEHDEDNIYFTCSGGEEYRMYHFPDCCENVYIDDINGNLEDLIGTEILVAEKRTNESDTIYGSETWTFYTIRTIRGSVDIKWYGESNGYYSEEVNFERVK